MASRRRRGSGAGRNAAINTAQSAAAGVLSNQAALYATGELSTKGGVILSNPYTAIAAVVVLVITGIAQAKQRSKAKKEWEQSASFTISQSADGSGWAIPHLAGRFKTLAIPVFLDTGYSLIAYPTQNVIGSMNAMDAENNGKFHHIYQEHIIGRGELDRVSAVWAGGKNISGPDLRGHFICEWINDGHVPFMGVAIQTREKDTGVGARPRTAPAGYALYPDDGNDRVSKPEGAAINRRNNAIYPWTVLSSDMYYSLAEAPFRPPFDVDAFGLGERFNILEKAGSTYALSTTKKRSSNPLHWWMYLAMEDGNAKLSDFDVDSWGTAADAIPVLNSLSSKHISQRIADSVSDLGTFTTSSTYADAARAMPAGMPRKDAGDWYIEDPVPDPSSYSSSTPLSSLIRSGVQRGLLRFEVNGVVNPNLDLPSQLDEIKSCMPGVHVFRRDRKYRAVVKDWETPEAQRNRMVITDQDLTGPVKPVGVDVQDKPAGYVVKYNNAYKNSAPDTQTVPKPGTKLAMDIEAEDGGLASTEADNMSLCDNPFHAADRALTNLFLNRRTTYEIPMKQIGWLMEPGTELNVTDNVSGLSGIPMEVIGRKVNSINDVTVFARYDVPSDHAPKLGRPVDWVPEEFPNLDILPPSNAQVAYRGGDNGVFLITWNHNPNQSAEAIRYRIQQSVDGGTFRDVGTPDIASSSFELWANAGTHTHQFQIRAEGQVGNHSDPWVKTPTIMVDAPPRGKRHYLEVQVGDCPSADVGVGGDTAKSTNPPLREWERGYGVFADRVGFGGVETRAEGALTITGGDMLPTVQDGDRFNIAIPVGAPALIPSKYIIGGGVAYLRTIQWGEGTGFVLELSGATDAPSAAGPQLNDEAETNLRFLAQKGSEEPLIFQLRPSGDTTEPYTAFTTGTASPNSFGPWLGRIGNQDGTATVALIDARERCGGAEVIGTNYAELLNPWLPRLDLPPQSAVFRSVPIGGCPPTGVGEVGEIATATNPPLRQWLLTRGWEASALGLYGVQIRGVARLITRPADNTRVRVATSARFPLPGDWGGFRFVEIQMNDGTGATLPNGSFTINPSARDANPLTDTGRANARFVLVKGSTVHILPPAPEGATGASWTYTGNDLATFTTILTALRASPTGWTLLVLDVTQRCTDDLLSPWVPRLELSGTDGLGTEQIFALSDSQTLSASQHPDNDWGYDQPGISGGLQWRDGSGVATATTPWLHEWHREVTGIPTVGAEVSNPWFPYLVTRAFGLTGDSGATFQELHIFQMVEIGDPVPSVPARATLNLSTQAVAGIGSWLEARPSFDPTATPPTSTETHQIYSTIATANHQDAVNNIFSFQESDWATAFVVGSQGALDTIYRGFDRAVTNADTPVSGPLNPPAGWFDTPEEVTGAGKIYQLTGGRADQSPTWVWKGPPVPYEGDDGLTIEATPPVTFYANENPEVSGNWRPANQRTMARWLRSGEVLCELSVDFDMNYPDGETISVTRPVPNLVRGRTGELPDGYQNDNPNAAPVSNETGISETFLGSCYRFGGTGQWTRIDITGTPAATALVQTLPAGQAAPTGGATDRRLFYDGNTFGTSERCIFGTYLNTRACLAATAFTSYTATAASLSIAYRTASTASRWKVGTAIDRLSPTVANASGTGRTYTMTGNPAGIVISRSSGRISGTPTGAGSGTITIKVVDGSRNEASVSFRYSISTVTRATPPLRLSGRTITGRVNEALVSTTLPQATGGGSGTKTYSLSNRPSGVNFNASNRVVSGTPTASGNTTATYQVSEGSLTPQTADVNFNIDPARDPSAKPPSITNLRLSSSGGAVQATWTASAGATDYEVQESYDRSNVLTGGATSYTFAAGTIPVGTNVRIYVLARNANGASDGVAANIVVAN